MSSRPTEIAGRAGRRAAHTRPGDRLAAAGGAIALLGLAACGGGAAALAGPSDAAAGLPGPPSPDLDDAGATAPAAGAQGPGAAAGRGVPSTHAGSGSGTGAGAGSGAGSGANAGSYPLGTVLAHLELDLPDLDAFVVRGVVPLPRRVYPMPGGLSPFALRDPDGTVVPAQVEIVSRHPRAADGADAVEVLARVPRPLSLSPAQRARYEVVWQPHEPTAFEATEDVQWLFGFAEAIQLQAHDVFGHRYTADLAADLREDGPELRVLRDGPVARQVRTHEVLMPAAPIAGPQGTLPHFLGVHAFITQWAGEPFVSLDLRIHNGGDGLDPADPRDDPLGDVYLRDIELRLPPEWRVLHAFEDPQIGKDHSETGWRVHPLIAPNDDGSLHLVPSQAQIQRRLVLVKNECEERARVTMKERNLAFCRPGTNDQGQALFSWWNPETPGYFPQKEALPELWHLGEVSLREGLTDLVRPYEEALALGTPGPFPVVTGALGWAHPWGVTSGYAHGGQEIHLYDGLRTAYAGSGAGYRYFQLITRMAADRHAVALFDADGEAITEEDWVVQGPNGAYMPVYLWIWPVLYLADPFGFGDSPSFQREAVQALGLQPPYEEELRAFGAIDTQHLIRHTRAPKVLAWLGNDALAKDELRLQAELARMSYSTLPQTPNGEYIVTGMLRDRVSVDSTPHEGFAFDRGEGWLTDTITAAYALAEPEWRVKVRPWFEELEGLISDGISHCSGVLGVAPSDEHLGGIYRVRQSISEAIVQNALWGVRNSVLRDQSPTAFDRLSAKLVDNLYESISPVVWNEDAHAPWFYVAIGPYDVHLPAYCDHTPAAELTDNYQTWSSFAYGYRLTGDPLFLQRAQEMLGEPLATTSLGTTGYGELENRAALLRLVQDLLE